LDAATRSQDTGLDAQYANRCAAEPVDRDPGQAHGDRRFQPMQSTRQQSGHTAPPRGCEGFQGPPVKREAKKIEASSSMTR
jgi:hypothetical protein